MNKQIKRVLLIAALSLLGFYLIVNYLGLKGFTVLEHEYNLQANSNKVFSANKITLDINSISPNLGITAIRFNIDPSQDFDGLFFRIREKGQENWYFEEFYPAGRFSDEKLFPFGFPIITDSRNKAYQVQLEKVPSSGADSFVISNSYPNVTVRHKYSVGEIINDSEERNEFIRLKIVNILSDRSFIMSLPLYFLPLLTYFAILKFKSLNSLKNIENNKKTISDFFLLDKNRSFPELDGIRAWAIIMVFMSHLSPWAAAIITEEAVGKEIAEKIFIGMNYLPFLGFTGGTVGVDLFFMLSGFLIVTTIMKNKPNFFVFIFRRIYRLLPVHLILMITFLPSVGVMLFVLNSLFLVHFFPDFINLNPVSWTLTYEFVFYLICALWLILGGRIALLRTWKFLLFLAVITYGSQFLLPGVFELFGMRYLDINRFMAFFFGVALARFYFEEKNLWQKLEGIFIKGAVPGILIIALFRYAIGSSDKISWLNDLGNSFAYLILDIGIFLLLGSLIISKDHMLKRVFRFTPIRIIGVISFSMYLFHYIWGNNAARSLIDGVYGIPQKLIAFMLFSFLITVLFSIILFHFLEKPYFLNRKKEKIPRVKTWQRGS